MNLVFFFPKINSFLTANINDQAKNFVKRLTNSKEAL